MYTPNKAIYRGKHTTVFIKGYAVDTVYYSSSATSMKQQILTDKTACSVFKDVYAKTLKRYNLK